MDCRSDTQEAEAGLQVPGHTRTHEQWDPFQKSQEVVAHPFSPSTMDTEAIGSLCLSGQPGLQSSQGYTEKPYLGVGAWGVGRKREKLEKK